MFACARSAVAAALFLLLSTQAQALTIQLTQEFDGVEPALDYATVEVTENGGDLDFSITLNGLLGPDEDAHRFYFNLDGAFSGLALTSDNAPTTDYVLLESPSVVGGAGSSFEWGVNLGNGGGPSGNGRLTFATFRLSANQPLTEDDLLEASATNGGIEAIFALHIQGTYTKPGSETVGGAPSVPEPSALALLALSGVLLGRRGRIRVR